MIELDFSLVLAVYFGLAVFGMIYNQVVTWLEMRGYLEGFTWLAVAVGVLVTMVALAVIDWRYTLIALGAFVFSGAPMMLGSIYRYVASRERSQRRMIAEIGSEALDE